MSVRNVTLVATAEEGLLIVHCAQQEHTAKALKQNLSIPATVVPQGNTVKMELLPVHSALQAPTHWTINPVVIIATRAHTAPLELLIVMIAPRTQTQILAVMQKASVFASQGTPV